MATTDMAKELLFDSIDLRFEEFGLPKIELDELDNDNNANTNPTKGTKNRKSRTRATRRKATVKAKARNKRLAKAKGYNLDACARPDKSGSRNVLNNRFCKGYKKWFPDPVKMEQNKVSARELKKYFDSLIEDEAREKEFLEEYYEDINDVSLEELVDEYLQLKAKGYSVYKDRFKFCTNRNQLLDLMTITDDDDYDPFSEDDYDSEYVSLHSLIYAMKKKEDKVKPLFEVVKVISEEYGYEVNVATERIPDWFDITEMKGGIFVREEYDSLHHEEMYIFYTETKRNEIIPLFEVTRNLSSNRYLSSLLRELDTEFLIKLDEYR